MDGSDCGIPLRRVESERAKLELEKHAAAIRIVEKFYEIQGTYTLDENAKGKPKAEMVKWLVEASRDRSEGPGDAPAGDLRGGAGDRPV